MQRRDISLFPYRPEIGCGLLAILMMAMCVAPIFLVEGMNSALQNLHLHSAVAAPIVLAILLGGFVNFPVSRVERGFQQPLAPSRIYNSMGWIPVMQRQATQTIIAVNLGGCVIPVLLAIYEFLFIIIHSSAAMLSLAAAVFANVAVCFFLARPMPGIGIAMPAFASPAVAIGMAWLLLGNSAYDDVRAPVAFIAGVSGPLLGADLLHLRNFARMSAGMISIGGAGTFDGIVISGMLAALLTG